jgi:hypothetical protein
MDRGVNTEGRLLDLALARQQAAVVADLHEAACGDFRPMQTERDLVIAIVAAGHRQRQMIEDALMETVLDREPVRRCEVDARLAACRFEFPIIVPQRHQRHLGLGHSR